MICFVCYGKPRPWPPCENCHGYGVSDAGLGDGEQPPAAEDDEYSEDAPADVACRE